MTRNEREDLNTERLRAHLLAWYAAVKRDLPWRRTSDPYHIWVSEVMLQQTRVAVVIDRFTAFIERFPTVTSLADADEQDVLALWSGLGYYRRARMLHKAAKFVAENLDGVLPRTAEELRKLPGIGGYTAAAIASIACNEPVAVVDGNVERVLCRLAGWEAVGARGAAALRRKIEDRAAQFLDPKQPGDFNQAMMELGATVCTPRSPQCLTCPLTLGCATRGEHKTAPRPRMLSREVGHALATRSVGETCEVLLEQRRATETVMPGMWQLPVLRDVKVPDEDLRMILRHAIMQVNYYVRIRSVREKEVKALTLAGGDRRWVKEGELHKLALTGLARKVLSRAHLLTAAPATAARRSGNALRPERV